MIVVIFISARAHMRYLRCSLVIYVLGCQVHNVTTIAVCALLKTTFYRYLTLHGVRSGLISNGLSSVVACASCS